MKKQEGISDLKVPMCMDVIIKAIFNLKGTYCCAFLFGFSFLSLRLSLSFSFFSLLNPFYILTSLFLIIGTQTEGIFRVPTSLAELELMRGRFNEGDYSVRNEI